MLSDAGLLENRDLKIDFGGIPRQRRKKLFVQSSVPPSTFMSKFGFFDIRDSCESETLHFENFYVEVLSTSTSKFGFLNIRDSCESETLHSNCP